MNLIRKAEAPVFTRPGLKVTGLASPKRGATENCVWRISLAPSTAGVPHAVTREEIFVGIGGQAVVTVDGVEQVLGAGDAVIVPPGTLFSLANPHAEPFEAVVTFPVGGQAVMDAKTFTPPWAE